MSVLGRLARSTARALEAAAAHLGTFEAAGQGSRAVLMPTIAAPHRQAHANRVRIGALATAEVANTTIGATILNTIVTSTIVDGVTPRSLHPNPGMARAIEAIFSEWQDKAALEGGGTDLTALLHLVLRTMLVPGECIVRLVTLPNGEPRLQILQNDQLDASRNTIGDGVRDSQGARFNSFGERQGYWIRPSCDDGYLPAESVLVPSSEILHVYEPIWPGQVRGVSAFLPAITAINAHDNLVDTAIETAKTKSLFCGVVKNLSGTATVAADLQKLMPLEPGTMMELPPDCDISFANPGEMTSLDAIIRTSARSICAAMSVPYEVILDLSQTSYSSGKMGTEAFKRRVSVIRGLLVARFLQPALERVITLAVLTGKLNAPDFARNRSAYFASSWLWSQWAALDSWKETQADALAVERGFKSRQQVISETSGRDPEEVDAEIAADTFEPTNVTPLTNPNQPSEAAA